MLPATYMIASKTVPTDSYPRASIQLNVIIRFLIKFRDYLLSFCFILFSMCFFAQSIEAAEDGTDSNIRFTPFSEQAQKPLAISTQTFSFDDVYTLKLNLNIPGNIRIVAIDSKAKDKNTVSVTIEKRVLKQNPLFTKIFLENIALTGQKEDGTLQLNSLLPAAVSKTTSENDSESDIKSDLHLSYIIKTPPDVSVQLTLKAGDVYLHHLRGTIQIINEMGRVHLDETLGNYHVEVRKGTIHGKILLAPGQSEIKTHNGSIDLTLLDDLAAPLDLTAMGGNIRFVLPKNYPADVELKSEKQHYVINLPAEIENNSGIINGGGPLLRLTATDIISVLSNSRLRSTTEGTESSVSEETISNQIVQPIPITEQSPTIDGNLSEKAWLNAVLLSAFQNPLATEIAENLTDVYLMWDSENLYIGGRAHLSSFQVPRVSQTQLDSPIWDDECIEILLDMDPETESYAHMVVNPIGAFFDQWVRNLGFPNFRFAPNNVPREQVDDSIVKFKSDSSWNSDAKVATEISTNFWSFEIAFPRKAAEKKKQDTWLFNVHRKAQGKVGEVEDFGQNGHREYSYWLPIYDEEYPWWPHWKEGMGALKLVNTQPAASKIFEVSESLKVTSVEIEGNTTIPTDIILNRIPIKSGDTLTNEQLAWLITELETFDWFKEVRLQTVVPDTNESGSSSDNLLNPAVRNPESDVSDRNETNNLSNTEPLQAIMKISVTEVPMKFAEQIRIKGDRTFPSQFIKDWFDLEGGYLAVTNTNLKQQMITHFYLNRGFPFAEVTHEFINDILQFNINEGYLDEVRFTGNRRIPQAALISTLDIDTKEVYYHALGQSKINQLHKKLSQTNENFKSIPDWHVQREGGKNILIVEIEEQPFLKPGWFPIVGFNRVHGLVLGAGGTLSTHFTGGEQIFGSVNLGFSSKIWNYTFGIEKSFFRRFPLSMGFGFFRQTDISSNAYRLLPAEADLSAAVYGTALEDYYQRAGEQIWIAQTYGTSSLIRLEFTQEDHDNLSKSTDWSYFDRNRVKRGNPRIEHGHLKMVSLGYTFDTRDRKSVVERPQNIGTHLLPWPNERTRRGWRGHVGIERAGGIIGGRYTFNLYKFELVRYTPLFGPHHLNVRFSTNFSNTPLPRQRLLYLGGATTLRGYDFNTYAGDKRILINIEYRLFKETRVNNGTDAVFGWAFSGFLDTGQVWWYDENPLSEFSLNQFKTSVGVGLSFFVSPPGDLQPFSTSVEIAVPLNVVYSLRKPRIIWRLERMF